MKQYGTLIALAVAVIFGIVAVILANQWLSTQVSDDKAIVQEQKFPLTKIVVAGQNLDIGSILNEKNLLLVDWPKANTPQGSFENIEEIKDRVLVTRVVAGVPIIAAELAAPGSGAGLVASIKPGMRAMAIKVNEVIGVAGFVLPNTFVDVISVQNKAAQTVLKRIEVLAIAQQTFVEEGIAKVVSTVTLELTPKQVEKLSETIPKGPMTLALLNPAEDMEEKPKPKPVKVASKKRAYKPRPAAPKVSTYDIVIIKGTQSVETVKLKNQN
ncbi:Flp pilus assembly protein CpaB [Deltaproteobacteria bacterium IMCC39524]|nr:Flp pilus assembly protein CpaB [Deltaproteobacteria bacterium IMCC39524]